MKNFLIITNYYKDAEARLTNRIKEYIENKAQIEVAREYELKPKPTLVATKEFLRNKIYFRIPESQ